jgi:hypothetical protein
VTSHIHSAEQQHRSIFQSDKAVRKNLPEKVKIIKNNLKLTKRSRAAQSSQSMKAFPLFGIPPSSIQQSPADVCRVRVRHENESIRRRKSAQLLSRRRSRRI